MLEEISNKTANDIHPSQRSYRAGKSKMLNVNEVFFFVQSAINKALLQRNLKIPVKTRKSNCLLFIDFKNAFDSVNRDRTKLITKL